MKEEITNASFKTREIIKREVLYYILKLIWIYDDIIEEIVSGPI